MISGQFTAKILSYLESSGRTLNQALLDEAGKRVQQAFRRQLMEEREDAPGVLRMSAGGQCVRKQWYGFKGAPREALGARTINTFLMGDICEVGLSILGRLAGWQLTGKPDGEDLLLLDLPRVLHRGEPPDEPYKITGHLDDLLYVLEEERYYVVEYKSMSEYSFREFEKNGLNDFWGYATQLELYSLAMDAPGKILVGMCKNTGHLHDVVVGRAASLATRALERWDVILNRDEMPEREFDAVPETTYNRKTKERDPTGRTILDVRCSYCPFRATCWPDAKMELKGEKPLWVVSEAQTRMDV